MPMRAPRSEFAAQQRREGSPNGGGSHPARRSRADRPRAAGAVARSSGSTSSTAGSNGGRERGNGGNSGEARRSSRPRDGRRPVGTATERRGPAPGHGGGGGGGTYYPGVIYDPYYGYSYSPYYGYGGYSSSGARMATDSGSATLPTTRSCSVATARIWPRLRLRRAGLRWLRDGVWLRLWRPVGHLRVFAGRDGSSSSGYRGVGSIRLKVKPTDAQVYVDGYFMGVVDSFDGSFQRLDDRSRPAQGRSEGRGIPAGAVRRDGYSRRDGHL